MPDKKTPAGSTEKIEGIPLYLIPKAIADQLRKKGEAVFRILVIRRYHHRYTVQVETFDEHSAQVNDAGLPCEEGEGNV